MSKDPAFAAAILAGLLFWAGLFFWSGSSPILDWPIRAPKNFLLLALLFPVLEELAFRGFLQRMFYETTWGRRTMLGISVANIATSMIFALAHLFRHPPLWAGLAFFPSLVFGFFRDRYGRVTPSIILHVFYNMGYFWLFRSTTLNIQMT